MALNGTLNVYINIESRFVDKSPFKIQYNGNSEYKHQFDSTFRRTLFTI
jgi:hypothetical protein